MNALKSLEEMTEIAIKEVDKKELDVLGGETVTWFELFLRVNSDSEKRCYDLQITLQKLSDEVVKLKKQLKDLDNRTSHVMKIG